MSTPNPAPPGDDRLPTRELLRLGVYLAPCLPLVVAPPLLFPYVTGRNFAFRILLELLLVPLVILAAVHRRRVLPRSGLAFALLAFLACVTVADLLGVDPSRSVWSTYQRMEGLLGLIHLGLFFVVLRAALVTIDDWRRYFAISIAVSAVVGVTALLQFGVMASAGTAVRPSGVIGNPGPLAGYLLLHVFLCLVLLVDEPRRRWRQLLSASLVFDLLVIYLSGTRSAVLALLISGPPVAVMWFGWHTVAARHLPPLSRRHLRQAAVVITLLALLAVSPITGSLFRGFTGAGPSVRGLLWPAAWDAIRERPWAGWGQETFHVVWNERAGDLSEPFDRSHNVVLEWLFTGGLLVAAAIAAVTLALARALAAVFAADRRLGAALAGLFAAWAVYALGWFDTLDTYLPLVSALAFADWFARPTPAPAPVARAWRGGRLVPVAAAGLAMVTAVYVLNVRPLLLARDTVSAMNAWAARRDVAQARATFERVLDDPNLRSHEPAEQMASLVTSIVTLRGVSQADEVRRYVARVVSELRTLTARPTPEVKHVRLLGVVAAAASPVEPAYWPLALESFDRALTMAPEDPTLYAEIAVAYAARGDFQTALAMQRRAIQLAPERVGLQSELVRLAMRAGTAGDVERDLFRRILRTMPVLDDSVAAGYLVKGDLEMGALVIEEMLRRDPEDSELRQQLAAVTRELAAQRDGRAPPDSR